MSQDLIYRMKFSCSCTSNGHLPYLWKLVQNYHSQSNSQSLCNDTTVLVTFKQVQEDFCWIWKSFIFLKSGVFYPVFVIGIRDLPYCHEVEIAIGKQSLVKIYGTKVSPSHKIHHTVAFCSWRGITLINSEIRLLKIQPWLVFGRMMPLNRLQKRSRVWQCKKLVILCYY